MEHIHIACLDKRSDYQNWNRKKNEEALIDKYMEYYGRIESGVIIPQYYNFLNISKILKNYRQNQEAVSKINPGLRAILIWFNRRIFSNIKIPFYLSNELESIYRLGPEAVEYYLWRMEPILKLYEEG